MGKEAALIACRVMQYQLESLDLSKVDVIFLDQGLHRRPGDLTSELQETINECRDYRRILLAYGRCSNGVVGLTVGPDQVLIIPRAEDCISLSLGSRERYLKEFESHPGSYYFTNEWVDVAEDPLKEYYKSIEKWDEETALWTAREMMKHYERTVFIHTIDAIREEKGKAYAKKFAEFFQLKYEEIDGSLDYLKRLLYGPWDEENFVVVPPGGTVTADMF